MTNLSKLKNQNKLEQKVNYRRQDLKLLKASIYYFYKLRNESKISDDTLHRLTRYSCALFVENQIENIYQKIIEDQVSKLWDLEILNIESDLEDLYSYEESSRIIRSLKKAYV